MVAGDLSSSETELPAPDPALHLLSCWMVAVTPEFERISPKARKRIFRRMAVLMDPTRPKVVQIRPRSQDKAVETMRRQSAAYWRLVEPALLRLIELGE